MKKRILYSEANYAAIVRDHGYFVDKTAYIAKLEPVRNPVFLRPRRFGKSLFCSLLRYYYDRTCADQFEELFGHTWIGQHPTGQQNQYLILSLNFSTIAPGPTHQAIEDSFKRQCNYQIDSLRHTHAPLLHELPTLSLDAPVADNLRTLLIYLETRQLPRLYVVIDEYDSFANQLITSQKDELYGQLTADDSFFKSFFKTLKEGREMGAVANVFITGILPILIDDLASGYNIASFITLRPGFEQMLGFTQMEVDQLLDEVYHDYAIDSATRAEVDATVRNYYNGYHFGLNPSETLYNATSLIYFLDQFTKMNENFYRTTFYELCSRYLSRWFTWNMERSYPTGKSDLEFVGKYHEKFAGLRWVIEFKYHSNAEFRKFDKSIETFELQAEDTEQIAGYAAGLRREYPQAQIAQYVIYCFGNQGFRVFRV